MSQPNRISAMETPDPSFLNSGSSQARLHYIDEEGKEQRVAIILPQITMGRRQKNDVTLDKPVISRNHAKIEFLDGTYWLVDIESRHGTFLNGKQIKRAKLKHGDRIQLGHTQGQILTFYLGDLLHSLLGVSDSQSEASLSIRDFRQLSGLLSAFHALSAIPLLDDLLALILDTAIELTRADRGFIMLKNGDEALSLRCARDRYRQSIMEDSIKASKLIPGEVFDTGISKVITNLDMIHDQDAHSSTRRLGLKSIFCVPLKCLTFRDHDSSSGIRCVDTIGVLYVDSQEVTPELSKIQLKALESLALEAAMAIYNARLYKISQEKRVIEDQIAIARKIQQSLLPPPSKVLPFINAISLSLPCLEVGGDYFDYFDLRDNQLGFTVGDVAGKGIPAALMASKIQGLFSALSRLDLPLQAMISTANRHIVERRIEGKFITLFYGVIDAEGTCTYTNAGHNPPVLLGRDGSHRELQEGGVPLGIFSDAQYEIRTVKFRQGEHLVLYTDGVVEALNKNNEEFGKSRLYDLLERKAKCTSEEILQGLQNAIANFSVDTPQHDDITMMVLGYRE